MSAKEVFENGGWLIPDVSVKGAGKDLATISKEEMWELFAPHMKEQETREIQKAQLTQQVHFFKSLHARLPACGRRLPFSPDDSTFSKPHATCRACLEAVREAA